MVATFVAAAALVFVETRSVGDALLFRAESREAGGGVALIEAPVALDAGRCAAIAEHSGVVGSGALLNRSTATFRTAPGILVQTVEVTSGMLPVWTGTLYGKETGRAGWIVGKTLSSQLGLSRGANVQLEGGETAPVGVVMPLGVRTSRPDRWLISVVPPAGLMDECWVEFDRQIGTAQLEYLTAIFADVDEATTRPLLRANSLSRDTEEEIRERISRNGWVAFVVVLSLLHIVASRARRRERALYTVLGTSRVEHLLMAQTEVAFVIILPAIAGALMASIGWLLTDGVWLEGSQPLRIALTNVAVGMSCCMAIVPLLAIPWRIDRLYHELRSE